MRCPRCLSTSLIMYRDENRSNYLRIRAVGLLGVLILDKLHEADMKKRGGELCKCQSCGFEWYAQKGELLEKYFVHLKPIFRQYDWVSYPAAGGGHLRLGNDYVRFSRPYRRDHVFQYETIVDVKRTEDVAVGYGWLTIRHSKNKDRPFPVNLVEAKQDKASICYPLGESPYYIKICSLLQAIIEENKKAGII